MIFQGKRGKDGEPGRPGEKGDTGPGGLPGSPGYNGPEVRNIIENSHCSVGWIIISILLLQKN